MWIINSTKPVSLDFIGWGGYTKTQPYQVILDDGRAEAALQNWLEHLSEKGWFDREDFPKVRAQALQKFPTKK